MLKFSIIGANRSIARNFAHFLKDKNVRTSFYDIQEKHSDGFKNYFQINFQNESEVKKIDFDCDAVFLFVGLTGAELSVREAQRFVDINEKVLITILNAIKDSGAKCKVIYPSSRLVYRDQECKLKEDDDLEAKSIYALNKIFAENCLKIYRKMYGIKYTVFRIAIPFGELNPSSSKYGILAKLVEQSQSGKINLFGDGSGIRTFTHIRNICEALYFGGTSAETDDQVFNIGGRAYTLLEIANMLSQLHGSDVAFTPWPDSLNKVEVKNGNLDSSKLDKLIKIDYIDIKSSLT